MTKAELEAKHLSDLHALAAESGVERYRMLPRRELIERLSDGESEPGGSAAAARPQRRERQGRPDRPERDHPQRERPPRRRRREGQGDELADEALGSGEALAEAAPPEPA